MFCTQKWFVTMSEVCHRGGQRRHTWEVCQSWHISDSKLTDRPMYLLCAVWQTDTSFSAPVQLLCLTMSQNVRSWKFCVSSMIFKNGPIDFTFVKMKLKLVTFQEAVGHSQEPREAGVTRRSNARTVHIWKCHFCCSGLFHTARRLAEFQLCTM